MELIPEEDAKTIIENLEPEIDCWLSGIWFRFIEVLKCLSRMLGVGYFSWDYTCFAYY